MPQPSQEKGKDQTRKGGKGQNQINGQLLIIYYVRGIVGDIRKGEHKIQTNWRDKTYEKYEVKFNHSRYCQKKMNAIKIAHDDSAK